MTVLTLSLELSSLRLIDFSSTGSRLVIRREETLFFPQEASHRQVLAQEVKDALRKIKKSWGLSNGPIHLILCSDFALLQVVALDKFSLFTSTATLVQRHAEEFFPLPLEQISIAYQEISHAPKILAYSAIKTDFLEAITRSIQEAEFSLQKISILPLSLYSLPAFKETLLIDFASQSVNFLFISHKKDRSQIYFRSLGNFNNSFCEQETGLSLLLFFYLKKELNSLINSKSFSGLCSIIKTHSSEKKSTLLSLFLKKEFSIPSIVIDPCLLLCATSKESLIRTFLSKVQFPSCIYQEKNALKSMKQLSWKRFLRIKQYHISSINKFVPPSIIQLQSKQRTLFLIYTLILFIILFSPLSLLHDYFENKEIAQEASKDSLFLQQRQLELKQLRQDFEELAGVENVKKKLRELQVAHDRWPLIINELQKYAPPRGIWITQLTPLSKEIQEKPPFREPDRKKILPSSEYLLNSEKEQYLKKEHVSDFKGCKEKTVTSEISALEIKGLYLEGINGEQLVHKYVEKLVSSSLFLSSIKEFLIFSCSKEDGTAYAYPFTLELSLYSPIRLMPITNEF